jgi:hypothetical protein
MDRIPKDSASVCKSLTPDVDDVEEGRPPRIGGVAVELASLEVDVVAVIVGLWRVSGVEGSCRLTW